MELVCTNKHKQVTYSLPSERRGKPVEASPTTYQISKGSEYRAASFSLTIGCSSDAAVTLEDIF